ncbi:MAG: tetratricopeptide repeat protein [Syntrophaceae bacterium]|nr:tetratricopeptide repeat protein [Syntrophaceae bacterium]
MRISNEKSLPLLLCLFLTLAVVAVYSQVQTFKLVRYDDMVYVAENQHVLAGLSREGVRWAFWNDEAGFWHPLTWLSLMADAQLYGLWSGGYHRTSALLHLGSTLLLFLFLFKITGAPRRSAAVAVLFALHPLNVEPVAWVAQRKDVLSMFFAMATLLAYGFYAKRPRVSLYFVVLVLYFLGLMAKPMIVTLPCVMLLLDVWPLRRLCLFRPSGPSGVEDQGFPEVRLHKAILEKLPLFLLSAAASILVVLTEQKIGALSSLDAVPMSARIANAVVSYALYLGKMLWPVNLAFFYPHPVTVSAGPFVLALAVLAAVTALVVFRGRRFLYLPVGWLWYLGALVPMIGLIQVGPHALADRYTYLPMIGVYMAIVWGAADAAVAWNVRKPVVISVCMVVLAALAAGSWMQLRHWQNSFTLFEHALRVTEGNYIAENNLGLAWYHEGKMDEALTHFRAALAMNPEYSLVYSNMGSALFQKGKYGEAETYLREAVRRSPSEGGYHHNLASTLFQLGSYEEAAGQYREALRLGHEKAETYSGLGMALLKTGHREEAIRMFGEALRIDPSHGRALEQWNRLREP